MTKQYRAIQFRLSELHEDLFKYIDKWASNRMVGSIISDALYAYIADRENVVFQHDEENNRIRIVNVDDLPKDDPDAHKWNDKLCDLLFGTERLDLAEEECDCKFCRKHRSFNTKGENDEG